MLKKILITLLFCTVPVLAGDLNTALNKGDDVFLYIYTQNCKYCVQFAPRFKKLTSVYHRKFTFFKIDGHTQEGAELLNYFKAPYVPFVVLMSNKKQKIQYIYPSCLMDTACVMSEMDKFKYNR